MNKIRWDLCVLRLLLVISLVLAVIVPYAVYDGSFNGLLNWGTAGIVFALVVFGVFWWIYFGLNLPSDDIS